MSRMAKQFKKYERHILLGVVVILLVSFSVTGAVDCSRQSARAKDFGGTFQATPNEEVSLDTSDMVEIWNRYRRLRWVLNGESVRYQGVMGALPQSKGAWLELLWPHVIGAKGAEAAGYEVGSDYQLKLAVQNVVQARTGGLAFSDATYERFLQELYNGSSRDFQEALSEVVAKDMFFEPIVDSERYGLTYEEAYDAWKKETEHVDLDFVSLRGRDFELRAREIETTRSTIQTVQDELMAVDTTARSIDKLEDRVESWRQNHDGKLPESLDALAGITADDLPKDAWEHALRYAVAGDDFTLVSDGPDGEAGTADDLDRSVAAELVGLQALAKAADGLARWRKQTGSWPDDLATLLTAPPAAEGQPAPLPPLTREPRDGNDQPLVYEAGETPRLRTADGAEAVLEGETWVVPPGPRVKRYLDEAALVDAWKQPMRVRLGDATMRSWDVRSAGPDQTMDTDDDVFTGNRTALEAFYRRPELQADYLEPMKRHFRTIAVHLPLVPDDVMRKLWEAYPQHRPDEKKALDQWRQRRDPGHYYDVENPADPKEGYGAALAAKLADGKPVTLVPSQDVFGEPPADLMPEDDPDREAYLEQGWRQILLREMFFEAFLNDLLVQARESEAPNLVTFESLLAGPLADVMPGEADAPYLAYFETGDEPLTLPEWEALPGIGDFHLTKMGLEQVREPGQYGFVPIIVNDNHSKVLLQNIETVPERQPELDEVMDEVFERYIEKRGLDLAAESLETLRAAAKNAASFPEAIEAWAASVEAPHVVESTGWFMGPRPPRQVDPDASLPAADQESLKRRQFVQQTGYETVRPMAGQTGEGTEVGSFGRNILRDERADEAGGTNRAYLVRVAEKRYPEPASFSAHDYSQFVWRRLLGDLMSRFRSDRTKVPDGLLPQALYRYYRDARWLATKAELKTAIDPFARPDE